jgi:hypothetical protein
MRRIIAFMLGVSVCLPPMVAAAKEFDFTKPQKNQFNPPSSGTRLIPPPSIRTLPVAPPSADSDTPPQPSPSASPVLRPVPRFDLNAVQYDLPKGTRLAASVLREVSYSPSDSVAMTLQISNDVRDNEGDVVIPKGSTVWGNFQPVFKSADEEPATARHEPRDHTPFPEGSRFVAEKVSIGDRIYAVKAQTDVLPTQQDPNRNVGAEAGNGALIGAAGGVIISLFTGGLGLIPVIASGALGAGVGAVSATQPVVIVTPDKPMMLTLVEPLRVH